MDELNPGKYYCSDDDCPQDGLHAHPSRRELIQLGDHFNCEWDEDEALGMVRSLVAFFQVVEIIMDLIYRWQRLGIPGLSNVSIIRRSRL